MVEHDRFAPRSDRAGEARPDRHPHALADLFLEPARRAGDEVVGLVLAQQHRCRIGVQDGADPVEQLDEQIIDVKLGQAHVGDGRQIAQPFLDAA